METEQKALPSNTIPDLRSSMTFQYEITDSGHRAPLSRDQAMAIDDVALLRTLISDAADVIIVLKCQLEHLYDNEDLHRRRVAALIRWRISAKDLKARLNQLPRPAKDPAMMDGLQS